MKTHRSNVDERALTPEEMAAEEGAELPRRTALSLIDTGGGGLMPTTYPTDGGTTGTPTDGGTTGTPLGGGLTGTPTDTSGATAPAAGTTDTAGHLTSSAADAARSQSGPTWVSDQPQTLPVEQHDSASAG